MFATGTPLCPFQLPVSINQRKHMCAVKESTTGLATLTTRSSPPQHTSSGHLPEYSPASGACGPRCQSEPSKLCVPSVRFSGFVSRASAPRAGGPRFGLCVPSVCVPSVSASGERPRLGTILRSPVGPETIDPITQRACTRWP